MKANENRGEIPRPRRADGWPCITYYCAIGALLTLFWLACVAVAQERGPGEPNVKTPETTGPSPAAPPDGDPTPDKQTSPTQSAASTSICLLVESAAQAHRLPVEFFTRLIWQESGFNKNAIGPVTRSGQRAQGIAQFMPATASERGVFDLFDPVAALPKSAEFLEELRGEFGNLGLAAAAYNAGPQRVRDWITGRGLLPEETRNYVVAITHRSVDDWAARSHDQNEVPPSNKETCAELIAVLKEQRSPFIGELERRVREGASRPWGVELSAGFARSHVLTTYAHVEKTYRTILEHRDPIIIASRFRSRGTRIFYQARVGADTRAAAETLCAALRNAGGACAVLRNWVGRARVL
jgi:hypothetical protein